MADDYSLGVDDKVTLQLGNDELLVATGYDIRQSILTQPAEFHLTLGQRDSINTLIKRYPPNTPFRLSVGGALQATGTTDGFRAQGSAGATQLTILGRDALAPLHDGHIQDEVTFTDDSYRSLVVKALAAVGLPDNVLSTNKNKRAIKTGVPVTELLPARTIDQILADWQGQPGGSVAVTHDIIQAKAGERWYDFVRHYLDRAGLFLWAAADGVTILSQPNAQLAPTYRILRKRGQSRNDVNVKHADYLFDTRPRFTDVVVYGKGGGKKHGRGKSKGLTQDAEMLGYGYKRAFTVRDAKCQSQVQAVYLAQRKFAETLRQGIQLVYTVAGHSTPSLSGGRAVWSPDTVVEVKDEEFGIDGMWWIDQVEFRRNPQTETTLRLMRQQDVLFGSPTL